MIAAIAPPRTPMSAKANLAGFSVTSFFPLMKTCRSGGISSLDEKNMPLYDPAGLTLISQFLSFHCRHQRMPSPPFLRGRNDRTTRSLGAIHA